MVRRMSVLFIRLCTLFGTASLLLFMNQENINAVPMKTF